MTCTTTNKICTVQVHDAPPPFDSQQLTEWAQNSAFRRHGPAPSAGRPSKEDLLVVADIEAALHNSTCTDEAIKHAENLESARQAGRRRRR